MKCEPAIPTGHHTEAGQNFITYIPNRLAESRHLLSLLLLLLLLLRLQVKSFPFVVALAENPGQRQEG